MITYEVIVPAKVKKDALYVPSGDQKPDIKANSLKEATATAVKLYGNTVMVIEPYNPEWQ